MYPGLGPRAAVSVAAGKHRCAVVHDEGDVYVWDAAPAAAAGASVLGEGMPSASPPVGATWTDRSPSAGAYTRPLFSST